MHPYWAEVIGTLLLVLLGNGVVANVVLPATKGHGSGWVVIAFGWGMAVFVAVWCVGAHSGGHLNPAVTLALALSHKFAWSQVVPYVACQMLGGFLGACLVWLFYRDHYMICDDQGAKLATFCTAPAIRNTCSNFLAELIGTWVLVWGVLWAGDPSIQLPGVEGGVAKLGLGSLGALPIGLLVLSIGLSLGGTTGYAINPARDLAPRLAHALLPIPGKGASDWGYAWVPVVGPLLGGALAVWMARFMLSGPIPH